MGVVFERDYLNGNHLEVENRELRRYIEKVSEGKPEDMRFTYYLLASTGICVVPLSSFNSHLYGFRSTLLEKDREKLKWIYDTLGEKIEEFLNSKR